MNPSKPLSGRDTETLQTFHLVPHRFNPLMELDGAMRLILTKEIHKALKLLSNGLGQGNWSLILHLC